MYKFNVNKIFQTTIVNPVNLKGIGLHTGLESRIKISPAEANSGIVFKRVDIKKNNTVKADYLNVNSTKLCTTLENKFGTKVSTVEHLLAAFYIAGIDNVLVEISSEEVPIMDGSAKAFLEILKTSEIETLPEKRKFLKVKEKVELLDGDRKISLEPGDETLEIEFQLNYKNKIIGSQKNIVNFDKDNIEDIHQSRTFCLLKDIEEIKKAGLAKGGSLDNAIVVDEEKVLNKEGLRNNKEFVNHKILDLLGDFNLSGYKILGKVKCYQGGHQLTNLFLRKLLKSDKIALDRKQGEFTFSKKYKSQTSIKIAVNG